MAYYNKALTKEKLRKWGRLSRKGYKIKFGLQVQMYNYGSNVQFHFIFSFLKYLSWDTVQLKIY